MEKLKVAFIHFSGLKYKYLNSGAYGSVFIENEHGLTVIKVLNEYVLSNFQPHHQNEKETIEHEIRMINYVTVLTPEYTCGPVSKIVTDEGFSGIFMKNAGNNLWINKKHLAQIEQCLLSLQLIHLLLCVSDTILVDDIKPEHIYFTGRHHQIQLKLIDFGEWKKNQQDSAWVMNAEQIIGNIYCIFRDQITAFAREFNDLYMHIFDSLHQQQSHMGKTFVIESSVKIANFIMNKNQHLLVDKHMKSVFEFSLRIILRAGEVARQRIRN